MARKRFIVSSAGGIAAGSPFVVGQGLIVAQVSPPFAVSARFGQAADAMRSFTAPDDAGGTNSLVLGEGSTTRGQNFAVIYGDHILQTGSVAAGVRFVGVGGGYDPGAAIVNQQDTIVVGWNNGATGAGILGGALVMVGNAIAVTTTTVNNTVIVGHSAVATGGAGVAVGQAAQTGAECVSVGNGARTNGAAQSVAVGSGADARPNTSVAVGQAARVLDIDSVAIGKGATVSVSNSIAIGRNAATGFADCIALGSGSDTQAIGDLVIGGAGANPIKRMRMGPVADSTYAGLTWFLSGADLGVNNAVAGNTTVAGGLNNGNAVGGEIRFTTATVIASGTTRQTGTERFAVLPSTGAAGAGGGILRFSGFTDGAAASVIAWTNGPTANQPVWIPVMVNTGGGPALHYIPAVPA